MARRRNGRQVRRWAAILGIGVLCAALLGTGSASAKPTAYPVAVTVTAKHSPQSCPGLSWVLLSGRVTSAKAACTRQRPILATMKFRGGGTYEQPLASSDGHGTWSDIAAGDKPLAWIRVEVEAQRLSSGTTCRAARSAVLQVPASVYG